MVESCLTQIFRVVTIQFTPITALTSSILTFTISPVRFFLAIVFVVAVSSIVLLAQSPQAVGEIVRLKGVVKVLRSGEWQTAQVHDKLFPIQIIQLGKEATVEIKWTNGRSTILDPRSKHDIKSLFAYSNTTLQASTISIFDRFSQSLLGQNKTSDAVKADDASEEARSTETDGLYIRQEKELTYEECLALYRGEDLLACATGLRQFLEQKPTDPNADKICFALVECYVKLNNVLRTKAQLLFFKKNYSNSPLLSEVEILLERLSVVQEITVR